MGFRAVAVPGRWYASIRALLREGRDLGRFAGVDLPEFTIRAVAMLSEDGPHSIRVPGLGQEARTPGAFARGADGVGQSAGD
ncbi:hypothetical protein [Streptomyces flavotricini]|uniref:hypothetical protein n=1 Tax=Streptomyces flavotricini TaxID=66888 RepID=UPI001E50BCCF|nr:hypothetical protein [Streptomyces flavotricini]